MPAGCLTHQWHAYGIGNEFQTVSYDGQCTVNKHSSHQPDVLLSCMAIFHTFRRRLTPGLQQQQVVMVMMVKQTCRHHRSTQWASARGLQQQQRQEGGRPRWLAVGPTLWAHSWMSRCVWDQGLQVIQYMPTWQSIVSLVCVAPACMCGTPGCMHDEGP